MKKTTLLIALMIALLLGNAKVFCQDDLKEEMKEAVQNLNTAYVKNDFDAFMQAHSFFERLISMNVDNYLAKYYLAYTEYRLYQFVLQSPKVSVDKYYTTGIEICRDLIAKKQFESEAYTVLSGILLMRVAVNQMEAMDLIPLIHEYFAKAEAANPNNPRLFIIKGIVLARTPAAFGGSVDRGLECYNKAVAIYAAEKKENPISWGLAETYAWIGQAYEDKKMPDKAKEAYELALKLEPEFVWVKDALLPQLEQKSKN